jgi:hypothetical protein
MGADTDGSSWRFPKCIGNNILREVSMGDHRDINYIDIFVTYYQLYLSFASNYLHNRLMSDLPINTGCPYCQQAMTVSRMTCHACDVAIEAAFPTARLANLPIEHQRFIEIFVLASGSLKQIAEQTGVSYPTVRSRLDKVIAALREEIGRTQTTKGNILDAVSEGKLTAQRAAKLIKAI